jgi:hypothetical protein
MMELRHQRLLVERNELGTRLFHLEDFIMGAEFTLLDPAEKERMIRQSKHMRGYLAILDERIVALEPK